MTDMYAESLRYLAAAAKTYGPGWGRYRCPWCPWEAAWSTAGDDLAGAAEEGLFISHLRTHEPAGTAPAPSHDERATREDTRMTMTSVSVSGGAIDPHLAARPAGQVQDAIENLAGRVNTLSVRVREAIERLGQVLDPEVTETALSAEISDKQRPRCALAERLRQIADVAGEAERTLQSALDRLEI